MPKSLKLGEEIKIKALLDTFGSSKASSDITNEITSWSSSDDTIATVDNNGIVRGKKAGKVTITAKYNVEDETVIQTYELEIISDAEKDSEKSDNKEEQSDKTEKNDTMTDEDKDETKDVKNKKEDTAEKSKNTDETVAKVNIPQTGVNMVFATISMITLTVLILVLYVITKKYKDIK